MISSSLLRHLSRRLSPRTLFWIGVLFSRLFLIVYLLYIDIGLMPDEAQYWTWSRTPSLGYYSKPPGIAWQISLSTFFFPHTTEYAVRALSFLIIPVITSLLLVSILQRLTSNTVCAYISGLLYLVSPIGLFGSVFATTDGMMTLAFFAALRAYIVTAQKKAAYRGIAVIAFWVALGALWKWTAYLMLPFFLACYIVERRQQKTRTPIRHDIQRAILGLGIAAIGLIPSLLWNIEHDWVTFRHVQSSLMSHEGAGRSGNFFEFLLASTALVSWGFFTIGLYGVRASYREGFLQSAEKTRIVRILAWSIAIFWGGLCVRALFSKIQGNWALLANAGFFIFVGLGVYALCTRRSISIRTKTAWICSSALFSLLVQSTAFSLHMSSVPHIVKLSPLKQGIDLMAIERGLEKAGYSYDLVEKKELFLLSDRYQNIAQIEFYAPGRPKEVYFFNIHNLRLNQYSFRSFDKDLYRGKSAYFIAALPERECDEWLPYRIESFISQLSPYFESVSFSGMEASYTSSHVPVRRFLFFRCDGFLGKEVSQSEMTTY